MLTGCQNDQKTSKINDFLITHTISPFISGVFPAILDEKRMGKKYLKVQSSDNSLPQITRFT